MSADPYGLARRLRKAAELWWLPHWVRALMEDADAAIERLAEERARLGEELAAERHRLRGVMAALDRANLALWGSSADQAADAPLAEPVPAAEPADAG